MTRPANLHLTDYRPASATAPTPAAPPSVPDVGNSSTDTPSPNAVAVDVTAAPSREETNAAIVQAWGAGTEHLVPHTTLKPLPNNEPLFVMTVPFNVEGLFINVTLRTGFTPDMIRETILHYRAAARALKKGTSIETMREHGFDKRTSYPMWTGDARVLCYGSFTIEYRDKSQMVNLNKVHEGTSAVEVVESVRLALDTLFALAEDTAPAAPASESESGPRPATLKPNDNERRL